eukprot:CAMPEP_0182562930 /NCGR_PEP_ID=MMETSP1324-20130603/5187_1 /TAXON_ID=236786 /ORGANISM="Florenciella sp., Strain RCC1587" /LENGTH=633 /DNA_ID=CAMNT_0024776011 /DNA_START=6 /DNA_END=1907 /DNA_ORIENTATION=-
MEAQPAVHPVVGEINRKRNYRAVLGAAVVVSPFVIGFVNYKGGASSAASSVMSALDKVKSPISSSVEQDAEYDDQLSFVASNEYTSIQGYAGKDYPWITEGQLAEPHKTTTFTSTSTLESDVLARMNLAWSVDGSDEEITGSFKYVFEQPGTYNVKMSAYDKSSGDLVASTTKEIISKYVRREIRTLTDDDREAFFSAAEVMYKTELGDGKKTYGDNFLDVQWFAQLHNTLAGSRECDHLHDGLGFLPQHAAFTLMFEKVLQLVNPVVTVPYWDYTIEAHAVLTEGSIHAWRESIVWSDDWFGEASPEDKVVTRGRFAHTPVVGNAWDLTDTTNAYGFVRAPWNMNKEKFVTRHNYTYGFTLDDAPGCKQHYDVMQYDQWSDFGTMIAYAPHGTVHAMIGGVWGADYKTKLENAGYSAIHAANVGLEAFATQKNLWRALQLECPDYCAGDAPALECKCTCPSIKKWMGQGWTHDILASVSPLFYTKSYLQNTNKHDISDVILKLMCNDYEEVNPIIGDSLESASPSDISFWPTHPTVDRLYHWKRIQGFKNDTWVDNMARSVSFTNVGYCWGHNLADVTVWKNLFDTTGEAYSNEDLWDQFDSTKNTDSPYIYDNFEWSHCEEEGYPLQLVDV